MKPKSNFVTKYYFKRFALVNAVIFAALFITRFFVIQDTHIILVYLSMLFGIAIYARINFELLRPYAGIGATLMLFWVLRVVLIFTVKSGTGVFAHIPEYKIQEYLMFLTNSYVVEAINLIGGLGIFFLIFDMYVGVKKIQKDFVTLKSS